MDEKGYEIGGDKMNSGKANYFLTVIISIVVAVGVLISLLSFFVLTLSIYLLLQKNTKKLQDLLMLGYSPAEVSAPYIKMVVAVNAFVLVASVALMLVGRSCYMHMIHTFGISDSPIYVAIAVAIVIMGGITAGNVASIRSKINGLWHQKE